MSDPAIEAAHRAYGVMGAEATIWDEAVTAAREALRPIREWVENCEAFGDELDIDDLKKLIYPTEELES
ncbi:hypothetical protein [Mycobacteroides chelonae]|uniref:hypothetical protein n=1 Tax=Mycobacteroides chelonae TaxID=1774 RepID=UPI0009946F2B|nr:hypothetical protein [Mycobacteroides chelonae]